MKNVGQGGGYMGQGTVPCPNYAYVNNHQYGSYETINSLSVEDDTTLTESPVYIADDQQSQYLYLLFQLISGDEIHIVSREVIIEEKKE